VDKVASFVALFGGNNLNIAVLTDYASGQRKKVEDLKKNAQIRDSSRVLLATDFVTLPEADIEDLFPRPLYLRLVDSVYQIPSSKSLEKNLSDSGEKRVVKDVEAYFNVNHDIGPEFDHYVPAHWLLTHPEWIKTNEVALADGLNRFESIFKKLASFLPAL
jgi:hypothetical protein